MPPRTKKLACAYVERGQRCKRTGTGNPPLCDPHRIILEAEAARPSRPGEKIVGLLGRVFRGQQINDNQLFAGIEDLVGMFQQHPNFEQVRENVREQVRERVRPHGRQPPPPRPRKTGPDPRVILGFAAGQKVTEAEVKARHRELARKHHPDRGGSVARMQEINAAVDQLLSSM